MVVGKSFPTEILRNLKGVVLLILLTMIVTFMSSQAEESSGFTVGGPPIIRPYDIYDTRFCFLTPQPFLCEKCLSNKKQLVQILTFEADGRPVRTYECKAFQNPYLN